MASDASFNFQVEDNSNYGELPPRLVLASPPPPEPKRGRGRPRKQPQTAAAAAAVVEETPVVVVPEPAPVVEEKQSPPPSPPVTSRRQSSPPLSVASDDEEEDEAIEPTTFVCGSFNSIPLENTQPETQLLVPAEALDAYRELCKKTIQKERAELDNVFWDLILVGGALGLSAGVLIRRIVSLF